MNYSESKVLQKNSQSVYKLEGVASNGQQPYSSQYKTQTL